MAEKDLPEIYWTKSAALNFQKARNYLAENSKKAATNFTNEIGKAISAIPKEPGRYPLDRFRKNNKGNYRAFELYSYRITYRTTKSKIYIVRFRHVKMKPLLH